MTPEVIRVSAADGRLLEPAWLAAAEAVHRQLRPGLESDYAGQMAGVFADGGEMVVALVAGQVAGVAVFRLFRNTHVGRRFYVDDLVTDDDQRSRGVGHALIAWLEREAASRGCAGVELESGTQRTRAHRFYFREGFAIPSFSFRKTIG
ncbi:MAG: GNAT family N-acetyltransferase [Betaproteobacteria bacterium]|nr:GNAT family N-acetyltransferase [Betaproteobacteria bacterium]